ncbi:MAG: nucleotidyltransferase domain-containing protein [archaeon]
MESAKYEIIAYSMDFASYLVQKIKSPQLKNIILFGSFSRDEGDKNSDIDIFIDLISSDKKIEADCNRILERFFSSVKYSNYWKLLGIKNEIKLTIGVLDEWDSLKPSIISNGITLYGKYSSNFSGRHFVYYFWENVTPNNKRVMFNKQMFGYSFKGKKYNGLIQKFKAERMGKGCIKAPMESYLEFAKLFKKYRIAVKIIKAMEL